MAVRLYFAFTTQQDKNKLTKMNELAFIYDYVKLGFAGLFLPWISGNFIRTVFIGSFFAINVDGFKASFKMRNAMKYDQDSEKDSKQDKDQNNSLDFIQNNDLKEVVARRLEFS